MGTDNFAAAHLGGLCLLAWIGRSGHKSTRIAAVATILPTGGTSWSRRSTELERRRLAGGWLERIYPASAKNGSAGEAGAAKEPGDFWINKNEQEISLPDQQNRISRAQTWLPVGVFSVPALGI